MSASIHDVAKRAGVSISTVSRVINHSAGVKESKTAAVLEAMEYYNYQPSQFGRGLVTRKLPDCRGIFSAAGRRNVSGRLYAGMPKGH